jgi:SAM-dependent methyltransferase
VDVRVGDLLALGGLGQPFDATLLVQVLEYVANVAAAVAGLADLTRPGGRFVNVATNWGALFWTGGNTALTARIVATWDEHAPHPNLPVALPSLLETSGFGGVRQAPVTIINRHFDPNTFGYGAARLMAAFALTRADVSSLDVEAWFSSLEEADAEGRYFLSSVPVLTTATRLG